MEQNIHNLLNRISESQGFFKYDSYENDYRICKGKFSGKLVIKDLLTNYEEETMEMLTEIFNDDRTNYNTRNIIRDIIKLNKLK